MATDVPNVPASKFANLQQLGVTNRHGIRKLPPLTPIPGHVKSELVQLRQKVCSLTLKLERARGEVERLKKQVKELTTGVQPKSI